MSFGSSASSSGDCDRFDGYLVVASPPTSAPHLCSHDSTTATLCLPGCRIALLQLVINAAVRLV